MDLHPTHREKAADGWGAGSYPWANTGVTCVSGSNEGFLRARVCPLFRVRSSYRRCRLGEFRVRAVILGHIPALIVRLASGSPAVRPAFLLRSRATGRTVEIQGYILGSHLKLVPKLRQ